MQVIRGDYTITLPAGSVLRRDGTSTCPHAMPRGGDHHFLPNRARTAFSCACGARVEQTAPAGREET